MVTVARLADANPCGRGWRERSDRLSGVLDLRPIDASILVYKRTFYWL